MQYDPIKSGLGNFFNRTSGLRILFYFLLDFLLLRAWHIKKELRKIRKEKGDNINVLDAGSGFGQYTWSMTRLSPGWKIVAVDVKTEQINDCNAFFKEISKQDRVLFQEADLTTFTQENAFDLILCVDVMEHILEDVVVFKNFVRSLKDGGILLISTPSDQGGSDVHSDNDESFIEEHVRDGYGIIEINNKLQTAGFSDVQPRFSYGWPGKISWRISMKYPVIMLGLSKIFYLLLPFYYLVLFPFAFLLNILDVHIRHKTGTGLIVKARK